MLAAAFILVFVGCSTAARNKAIRAIEAKKAAEAEAAAVTPVEPGESDEPDAAGEPDAEPDEMPPAEGE